MSTPGDRRRDPPQDRIAALNDEIRETANYGEVVLQGDIGVHSFFVPENASLGIGQETALLMAFSRASRELCLDPDVVETNQGEVTPQAVADEATSQIEDLIGTHYFFERFHEELESILNDFESRHGPLGGDDE